MRWLTSFAVVVLTASLSCMAQATELPYDEHANATEQVHQAVLAARAAHKDVLLVFGANWCPDCRVLDSVLHDKAAINDRFVIVKVDVGNFNKNLDLAKRYEVPLGKGIPAAAVVSGDDAVLVVTQGGELANAHHMGETAIVDLFSKIIADAAVADRAASSRSP
jgi:thioredoxin 1